MLINYILILLVSIILNYVILKKIITVNILYTFTWVLGGVLNLVNYGGLYTASSQIHSYIITSIITFNAVYWIFTKKKKQKIQLAQFDYNIPTKSLEIINLCCQIYMIPFLFKAIIIIMNSSFSNLRKYAYVASEEFTSLLESRIISWIICPLFLASIIIVVTLILLKKSNAKLNIMILIDMFLYTVTLGGKLLIVTAIIMFIFGYVLLKTTSGDNNGIKIEKRYYIIFAVIMFYLVYVTQKRALKGLNVVQNFVVYLYGGISYFSAILKSPKYLMLNSVQLYGTATYGFVLTPILYISYHVFGTPNINAEYITKLVTSNYAYVSKNYTFNSLPTALYYFWRDFHGIPGIIFGTCSICLLFILIENMYYKHKDIRWFVLYLFLTYEIFTTTQTYGLFEIKSFINIFFILLLTSKKIMNLENKMFAQKIK